MSKRYSNRNLREGRYQSLCSPTVLNFQGLMWCSLWLLRQGPLFAGVGSPHFCISASIHLGTEVSRPLVQCPWVILLAFSLHLSWEGGDAASPMGRRGHSLTSQALVSQCCWHSRCPPWCSQVAGKCEGEVLVEWHCLVWLLFRMPWGRCLALVAGSCLRKWAMHFLILSFEPKT